MSEFLDRLPSLYDPLTLRLLLPLAAAFLLAGLIGLAGGARGRAAAGAAIAMSALAVHVIVAGWPALPAAATADKIVWLTLAGLLLGLALDLLRMPRSMVWLLFAVWPAVVIGWIGFGTVASIPRIAAAGPEGAFQSLVLIALLVGFWIAASAVLTRLRAASGSDAGIMLVVGACGLGFVLLRSGLPQLGGPALALGSAAAGFLLWNVGRTRFPFGDAAVLGGGTLLLAIGAAFGLAGRSAVALVVLMLMVLVFFADRTASRVPLGGGRLRRFTGPLVLAGIAAVPALAAMAVAMLAL